MTTTTSLRFYWNGIKAGSGRLQRCSYSEGPFTGRPAGTITIYGKDYIRFSPEIREAFRVENDTDTMTDYFENDRIRVEPSHPLYAQVLAASRAQTAHWERMQERRRERWKAKAAA